MTEDFASSQRRHLVRARAVVLLLAAGAFGFAATAQQSAATATSLDLERAFWACDHAATRQMIDYATATTCSAITERLKLKKFGGDFEAMLAWWRLNKEVEHLALDAVARQPQR